MKNFKKTGWGALVIVAAAAFFVVLAHALLFSSARDLTVATASDAQVPGNTPIHLLIPAIGVNAKIQNVGVTRSGRMAVPNSFSDTGWYKYGPVPGQQGSAVIAGHVDDGLAFPGVFKNLNGLRVGDDIYVTLKSGTTLHFVVTGSEAYSKDATTGDIFSDSSGTLLKLITCTGTWLPDQETHDQRLVVTAKLQK